MLIASLLEPKKARVGDYWYSLASRVLHEACNSSQVTWHWVGVPYGTFDAPTAPRITPTSITMPIIWIRSTDPDRIPHMFDAASLAYIPVVPLGYIFPPPQPTVGICWHDTMSGFDFTYTQTGWQMMGASGGAQSSAAIGTRCAGCFAHVPPGAPTCPNCNAFTTGAQGISPGLTGNLNVGSVTSGGIGHLVFNPAPNQPMLTLSPNQSALNIANLVEIFADGRIVYDITYTPDKAAEALWEAIAQMSPIYKENQKIKVLETSNEYLEKVIQMYKDAGCKLPGPIRAPDPNAAWNAAMGVII